MNPVNPVNPVDDALINRIEMQRQGLGSAF
jgi:hypothetical protein